MHDRDFLLRSVGNIAQLASIRRCELADGRAKGCRIVEVNNGGGLAFTLMESKALDIVDFSYKGVNLCFKAKAGLSAPEFFNPHSQEFERNFEGGLLFTSGLLNVGSPCVDEGMELSQHGRIGQSPIEALGIEKAWQGDEYLMKVSGEAREAALFRENLVLRREVTTSLGSKSVSVRDSVENQGFERQPLMILYHINLGYPLLSKAARFVAPLKSVQARDAAAEAGKKDFNRFSGPIDHEAEQVFYLDAFRNAEGTTMVGLVNDELELGLGIEFNTKNLPRLIEWKSMMSGDYALGIEPANCLVEGRSKERQRGDLHYIEPLQKIDFNLCFTVLDGRAEIANFEHAAQNLFTI